MAQPKRYLLDVTRALELGLLVEVNETPDESETRASTPDEESSCYRKFLMLLPLAHRDVGQREVLRYIQEHPEGTTVPEMAGHFEDTTNTIVGIINGGLQRNIKKAGFAHVDRILRIVKEAGQWRYYPSDLLVAQPPIPLK